MNDASRKGPSSDRFGTLLEESRKFCIGLGLPTDLILAITKADSDWAFILKVDALIETAAKEIVRHALRLKILNQSIQNSALEDFVDSLPINGRTSIVRLLDAAGLPDETINFIEAIRRVRNAYAHSIKLVDVKLITLIESRKDKSDLLKKLSNIKQFDEAELIRDYKKDPIFLRFCIIDAAMQVLFFSYHMAVKHAAEK
jgi:hypothetical protein